MRRARIAVLASGHGTNLQVLLDACADPGAPAEVCCVLSNKETAGALDRGRTAGVPAEVIPSTTDDGTALLEMLAPHAPDILVLAGYLKLVPPPVIRRYTGRTMNIHPALLPAFGGKGMYGRHVHKAVLEAGVRVSGVTVHLVDEEYDRGPILSQWPVPVIPGDTPDSLARRVMTVEHQLLPATVFAAAKQLMERGSIGPFSAAGDGFRVQPAADVDLAS